MTNPIFPGIVVNAHYTLTLSGNSTLSGSLGPPLRWYYGAFKYISLGSLRAVYRALKIITINRNIN